MQQKRIQNSISPSNPRGQYLCLGKVNCTQQTNIIEDEIITFFSNMQIYVDFFEKKLRWKE